MASPAFLTNSIIHVMQTVADFLANPFAFTTTAAAALSVSIEGLRGGIQALPLNFVVKADLINRLNSVQGILAAFIAGTGVLTPVEVLLAVLGLLELLKEKILALNLKPCIGTLTVCFPPPFSTACNCC